VLWWFGYRNASSRAMALVSPYCDVVTARLADVIDAMDAGFAGDRPRTWVNPHPNMQPPSDAEYSRLPDPAKYATVQQRCRAWITALLDADLATSQSTWQKLEPWGRVETLELTPTAPEAVRLFVHFTVDYLPGVVLALGDPMGIITTVPACGCDACDDGSAQLLEEIDNVFTSILLGVAVVEHTTASRRVVLIGQESGSTGDQDGVVGRWAGQAWLVP